jgi:hypothetical protein
VALPQQSWRKRRKLGWLLLVPLLLLPLYLRRCQEATLPPCEVVLPVVLIVYDSSGSMAFPLRMPEQLVNDYADDYLREQAQQAIYQSLEGLPPAALKFGRRFLAPGAGEQFPGKLDWVRQNLQEEIERFGSPRALVAREAVEQLEKSFVGGMKYTPIVFTDCDSIDGPVDSLQQGQLANAATVLDYEPGNASPVAGSLAALEEFMSNGDVDNNVAAIMFSDGVESCDGDPCAQARQLQQKFPNLSVNILHLGPETYSSCIAEATGGKQYPLDDLSGLVADIRAMATVSTTQSECSLAEKAE